MKCAIMQPTYLPWAGYFNLISLVDIFIFLDDVQYEKVAGKTEIEYSSIINLIF